MTRRNRECAGLPGIKAILSACLLGGAALAWAQAPVGWAGVNGNGQNGTTGGQGGTATTVANEAQLTAAVKGDAPKIVKVSGMITLQEEVRVGSNTTLEGAAAGAGIAGSLGIIGKSSADVKNVIVRNLVFRKTGGAGEDAISIRRAHHVWIDHNDLADSPDGLLDVTNGSDYVTISWNRISYSSSTAGHRFAMLFGNSDDAADEDAGKLRITVHHNWLGSNVIERMPRIRFGQVHVFNNYYSGSGNNYCVGAGFESKVLVQNNYFDNVKDPHIFYDGETTAQIVAEGNVYIGVSNTSKRDAGQGAAFTPPYQATLVSGTGVKTMVMDGAGPFKTPTTRLTIRPGGAPLHTGSALHWGHSAGRPSGSFSDLRGRKLVPGSGDTQGRTAEFWTIKAIRPGHSAE